MSESSQGPQPAPLVSPDRLKYWDGQRWAQLPGETCQWDGYAWQPKPDAGEARWNGSQWKVKPQTGDSAWDGQEWVVKPEGVDSVWHEGAWVTAPDDVESRWDGTKWVVRPEGEDVRWNGKEWKPRPEGKAYWNGQEWRSGWRPLIKFGIPAGVAALAVAIGVSLIVSAQARERERVEAEEALAAEVRASAEAESRREQQARAQASASAAAEVRASASAAAEAQRQAERAAAVQQYVGTYFVDTGGFLSEDSTAYVSASGDAVRIVDINTQGFDFYPYVISCFSGFLTNIDDEGRLTYRGTWTKAPITSAEGKSGPAIEIVGSLSLRPYGTYTSMSLSTLSDGTSLTSKTGIDGSQADALWAQCPTA